MILWLLRRLGMEDTPVAGKRANACCPESPAERRLERVERDVERTIRRADHETERVLFPIADFVRRRDDG